MSAFDAATYLKEIGSLPDEKIDLAKAALALAAANQPGISTERYMHHLKKLSDEVAERYENFLESGADEDAGTQLAALKDVLSGKYGYRGDQETYDDFQNANLIRVIDRVKGLPITLSILYIHVGQAQGWDVSGLDFPGHFICRLEKDGRRLIFDPFNDCKILEAPDLRGLLKKLRGGHAELSAHYFELASTRAILIRLQNNIKYRQIEGEDYSGALKTVETMRLIDPGEYRLLLDAGVLYARTDQARAAIDALEEYIKLAPADRDRNDAAILLLELKNSLQ
jgi:regulator of sirC expression with transglutaminase-like and TPR domain